MLGHKHKLYTYKELLDNGDIKEDRDLLDYDIDTCMCCGNYHGYLGECDEYECESNPNPFKEEE